MSDDGCNNKSREKKRHWKIKLLLKNHIIYLKEI